MWVNVKSTGLAGGDKLVLPFHGKMLTLTVITLIEGEHDVQVSFGVDGGFLQDVFPNRSLDLTALPEGWRVFGSDGEIKDFTPPVRADAPAPARGAKRRG